MRSDEALFEAWVRGDVAAFDQLYARFERPLFGFILGYLKDPAEAEDVLHETFLAVLRQRGTGAGAQSLRAWLYQVARNASLNRLRAAGRAGRTLEAAAREDPAAPAAPDARLEAQQRSQRLDRAVGALPEPMRELYALRARGLSLEDLSHALAVPLGTVKSRLHALVKRLQEELSP